MSNEQSTHPTITQLGQAIDLDFRDTEIRDAVCGFGLISIWRGDAIDKIGGMPAS